MTLFGTFPLLLPMWHFILKNFLNKLQLWNNLERKYLLKLNISLKHGFLLSKSFTLLFKGDKNNHVTLCRPRRVSLIIWMAPSVSYALKLPHKKFLKKRNSWLANLLRKRVLQISVIQILATMCNNWCFISLLYLMPVRLGVSLQRHLINASSQKEDRPIYNIWRRQGDLIVESIFTIKTILLMKLTQDH